MRKIQEKLSSTRTFDESRKLEMVFKNVKRHEVAIVILYEFVPQAGKVLLKTAFALYGRFRLHKRKEASAKDVLNDLRPSRSTQ